MTSEPEQWGPNLYAWLDAYWQANDTNANAWTHANPGLQGATVSRWRTGTIPSLIAMCSVAVAVGRPLVDILAIAGVIDADGETTAPPAPPSIDVAIEADPNLSDVTRRALRDLLAAIREVENGKAATATARIAPRKRASR